MTNDNRQLQQTQDVFNNLVTNRTNVLDQASHYPYSPVRWRLFVDGSRIFPEYETTVDDLPQYRHAGDVHELTPQAGETVAMETTERPRYVVQYELAATFALALNKAGGDLQGDDRLRAGLWDGEDGWYVEHNATHEADKGDFVEVDGGTETYRESNVDVLIPWTRFSRWKLQTGWYKLTRQKWERSYSSNGHQINEPVTRLSSDDNNGPETGNLPTRFEIRADAATTDLRLDAGSVAQVNLGTTTQQTRDKQTYQTATIDVQNEWVPLDAFRIKPGQDVVNVQIEDLTLREINTSADTFILAQSFDPQNVADANGNPLQDSNFNAPEEHSDASSVIQINPNAEQIVDNTQTLVTSTTNPGGYQVEASAIFTGTGQEASQNVGPGGIVKRQLTDRDYLVIIGKAASTGAISYSLQTEQDW